MPSGRVHFAASAALLAGGAWLVATQQIPAAALLGLGAGALITPDLDVDHQTAEEARVWRISRLVGLVWQVLWYPYAWVMPHRSPWSHAPLVGTAGRILYLAAPVYAVGALTGHDWLGAAAAWPGAPWALAGWALQDALHWLMDLWIKNGRRGR